MSLSPEEREEIGRLVEDVAVRVVERLIAKQRRESLRLILMVFDAVRSLEAGISPFLVALAESEVLDDGDLEHARDVIAAELAAHPRAEEWRRASAALQEALKRPLDFETEEGE